LFQSSGAFIHGKTRRLQPIVFTHGVVVVVVVVVRIRFLVVNSHGPASISGFIPKCSKIRNIIPHGASSVTRGFHDVQRRWGRRYVDVLLKSYAAFRLGFLDDRSVMARMIMIHISNGITVTHFYEFKQVK
jgi:hypothetical protein